MDWSAWTVNFVITLCKYLFFIIIFFIDFFLCSSEGGPVNMHCLYSCLHCGDKKVQLRADFQNVVYKFIFQALKQNEFTSGLKYSITLIFIFQ